MSVLPILTMPNTILVSKSEAIKGVDSECKQIVKDLTDTIEKHRDKAAGLSAPQIGFNKRICIVKHFFYDPYSKREDAYQNIVLINPKIVSTSKETELDWEGCLSIPDTYGTVERYEKVKVRCLNEHGEQIQLKAAGYLARVIQHEIDHLDGVLFTSKIIGKTLTEKEIDDLLAQEED